MKRLSNILEYNQILTRYNLKGCLTNDYIQREAENLIIHNALYADCYNENVFLFVKRAVGIRVYYYINDINEMADFSQYHDLVVEILFRGELPENEIQYFVDCGFKMNLVRDQYSGIYKNLMDNFSTVIGVVVNEAQTVVEVKEACELFYKSFDRLSGDQILANEYNNLLKTGSVLIAKSLDEKFLGALHQIKGDHINILGHISVLPNARGYGVGSSLVDAFVQRNMMDDKTRYQLWVQRQNEAAVNMYKKKGFVYTNKSTISLIKL